MTTQAEALAEQFAAANDALIAAVAGCAEAAWRRPCEGEDRTIGVTAHHVAVGHAGFAQLLGAVVAGQAVPTISLEELHAMNARHVRDHAEVGRAETLDALRRNGEDLTRVVRGLSDEQLGLTTPVFGGREMSVGQIVELVVIGHPRQHLESIRAALGA
ncbi:MAG TPA: DinB family protein [Thermomicrobiales bacterium]|jgi:hypothetical protein